LVVHKFFLISSFQIPLVLFYDFFWHPCFTSICYHWYSVVTAPEYFKCQVERIILMQWLVHLVNQIQNEYLLVLKFP
jgi:hypothetical protein